MTQSLRLGLFAFLVSCLMIVVSGCASFQDTMFDSGLAAERSLACMHKASVNLGGRWMTYLERQGDGETIVLVHGFGADKDNWVRFVRHIPSGYRIIAFDLPGHGESFRDWNAVYSIDFITNNLAEAIDALGLRRFHLAGNSMGGLVGMVYTAGHPDRVATLALIDTAGIRSPEPSDRQKAYEEGKNVLVPRTEDEFKTLLEYAFHRRPFLPWPAENVLARRAVADAPFKQKMFNEVFTSRKGAEDILGELRAPVLILWGDKDRIIHVSTVEVLRRSIPQNETFVLKDCGHMPMIERPEETARIYIDFLKRHTSAAGQGNFTSQ